MSWVDALPAEGEMLSRLRDTDWAQTPLGPVEEWPETLRAAVAISMASRFPMLVVWGPERVQVYNDAFIPLFAEKHPQMGERVQDTWAEIWDVIGPLMDAVLETGEATWAEDQMFWIDRLGFLEDIYFTFSYSPIIDRAGVTQGLLATAVETTAQVVDARRTRLVGRVGAQQTPDVEQTARAAARVIAEHGEDLPFALVYLRGDDGSHRLAGAGGLDTGSPGAPDVIAAGSESPWPLDRAGEEVVIVGDVAARAGEVTHRLSGRPVHSAAVVDLGKHGTLVLGLSPARRIDDGLRSFLSLLGTQLEGALAVAAAIQTEHARVDELLELDRAKSTFFSNVSHELRTPVTLMLAPLADALGDTTHPLSAEQRERIATAHRNAGRLIGLVDDVLDFTREGAAARRPRPERLELGALTAELAGTFGSAAARAGLDLDVHCPDPGGPVWMDPFAWERIVLNLVGNAVKYTAEGTITVRLRDTPGGVRLEVADTGTGIPDAELERVFERFHRVPNEHARSAEGAGIGLALVRRLVEQHGGTIGVQSTLGEGSTFWVELPVGTPPPSDLAPTGPAPTLAVDRPELAAREALGWIAGCEPSSSGNTAAIARVLFADDNADMRAYVARVLGAEFAVDVVPNGAAAFAAARADPPDLVLTDVLMPELDGFELLEKLRADPATAPIPVVMLSARAGDEAIVGGLEAGADEYLLKPFTSAELLARVRSTIALTQSRAALVRAAAQHEADLRLLRAEARFRHAGRAARVGTWSVDLATDATEVDANFEHMFGVAPGTLTSLADCLALVVPEDRARLEEELALVADGRADTIHEFRMTRPDGGRRVFQWRASVTQEAPERPAMLFGAIWDATALADAQAAIRETEQAAPAGIAIVELDGTVSRANRALGELLDRSTDGLTGVPFATLVHPDDDAGLDLAATHPHTRELRLLDAHENEVWATVSSAPVRGADGRPRHVVVHVQDARERKRFERELQHLANHDALTELWNRRRFNEELERALGEAQRYGHRGALLLFDVDGLKHVNDTLGHAVGDELLVAVADVLRDRLRTSDTPARLGGDEYAVLVPYADEEAARAIADDLLGAIAKISPLASSAGAGRVTACVGVAMFGGPDDAGTAEDLLVEADTALYAAKDAGRGQVRVRATRDPDDPARAVTHHPRINQRIREALANDRFVLHGQPIVALGDDPSDRCELLLRMEDEDGTLRAPASFLPTAERSTLIQEIDRWVVSRAVRELADRRRSERPTVFAINLSAKSIIDPGMGRFVLDEIDRAGVDGSRLVFEVTETSAIMNLERARAFVRTILERGCSLALDDFGAGFTSFHYLRHFDFRYVKIDGSFIQNLPSDRTNQSLVRALSAMAHDLGKQTVAECVGDEATVDWLRGAGVDYAQGFHLGRPGPL